MQIAALQKTTMLDFPGKISALVFTQGCNFHCPYCHNPELLKFVPGQIAVEQVLSFLAQRHHLLQGVVISGGEPTLHGGLVDFCRQIKNLGYAIKLDTNGSNCSTLKELLEECLVDYVAMDIKATPGAYPSSLCHEKYNCFVQESMELLNGKQVVYEFRISCVYPLVTDEVMSRICTVLGDKAILYLQKVRLEKVLAPEYFHAGGRACTTEELRRFMDIAKQHGKKCVIRE